METIKLLITLLTAIAPVVILFKVFKKKEIEIKNEAENSIDKTFHDLHLWLVNHGINISKLEVFALKPYVKAYPSKRIVDMKLSKKNKNELNISCSVGFLLLILAGLNIGMVTYYKDQTNLNTALIAGMLSIYLVFFAFFILHTNKPKFMILRISKTIKKNKIKLD